MVQSVVQMWGMKAGRQGEDKAKVSLLVPRSLLFFPPPCYLSKHNCVAEIHLPWTYMMTGSGILIPDPAANCVQIETTKGTSAAALWQTTEMMQLVVTRVRLHKLRRLSCCTARTVVDIAASEYSFYNISTNISLLCTKLRKVI